MGKVANQLAQLAGGMASWRGAHGLKGHWGYLSNGVRPAYIKGTYGYGLRAGFYSDGAEP